MYEIAEKAVTEKAEYYGRGTATIHAWTPAFDSYDGSERFWRHYELSQLDDNKKLKLYKDDFVSDYELETSQWLFVWSVMVYYSVLAIGGNELTPAQPSELAFVTAMNIAGLIFTTWIIGEIAVVIYQLGA